MMDEGEKGGREARVVRLMSRKNLAEQCLDLRL